MIPVKKQQQCYLQGTLDSENSDDFKEKLKGISKSQTEFSYEEKIFQHPKQPKEMGEQRVRKDSKSNQL